MIYLFFAALPFIKTAIFFNNSNLFFHADWFLPYGVWLFALSGFAAIPEVRDIFAGHSINKFKKVILFSLTLTALFYLIFIFSIWGVSGANTTEDALSGIILFLGAKAMMLGSLIGFLAVFTSFLALAADMKNIFIYDYKIPKFKSWILTSTPPIILFLLGVNNFVGLLGIIGALGLGISGAFIILMKRKLSKAGDMVKSNPLLEMLVLIGVIIGALFELSRIFF